VVSEPDGGTGVPSILFGPKQRSVVIERFRDLLSFPARTYKPQTQRLRDRPEDDPSGYDARMERLDTLREALDAKVGLSMVSGDFRMVAQLLELGAFGPSDVAEYQGLLPDLDLSFLERRELLRYT
jgi:hypothetical protein